MGRLEEFDIVLDQDPAVYNPGQTVSGNVVVELSEHTKMRGIHLKFSGNANVEWTEAHTEHSEGHSITKIRQCENHRPYFNETTLFIGKMPDASGPEAVHLVGRHVYPFSFTLPQDIPSSFEGLHGKVRYLLQCVIDKPWKTDDRCTRAFTVVSVLDLNLNPNAKDGMHGEDQTYLCCFCCMGGPIAVKCEIDRRGYVPGEFVSISGEVNNQSNRMIGSTVVKLKMVTSFTAADKTISVDKTVSKLELPNGDVSPGDSEAWSGERLHIPPLPPSLLPNCDIISVYYKVVMVVQPACSTASVRIPFDIVIGTVPIQSVEHVFSTTTENAYIPLGETPSVMLNKHQLPPTPSFAECVSGRVNLREIDENEHAHGELDFAPMYSYYSLDTEKESTGENTM